MCVCVRVYWQGNVGLLLEESPPVAAARRRSLLQSAAALLAGEESVSGSGAGELAVFGATPNSRCIGRVLVGAGRAGGRGGDGEAVCAPGSKCQVVECNQQRRS